MGTLSQVMDYMGRNPENFYSGISQDLYTQFTITPSMKNLRRKNKWYSEPKVETKSQQLTLNLI